jgi:hypothetical protein
VGAGFEFFPGTVAIQVRGDYLYDMDVKDEQERGAAAVSGALRWRW